jgi:K+-sensing histidine kinase KdpD
MQYEDRLDAAMRALPRKIICGHRAQLRAPSVPGWQPRYDLLTFRTFFSCDVGFMGGALRNELRRLRGEGLSPGSPVAYFFAIACIIPASLMYVAYAHFIDDITPSVPFYPTIFVVALFGGIRAGIVAVVISAVVVWWGFDSQYFGNRADGMTQAINRGLYVAAAVLIIWAAEHFRRAGSDRQQPAEPISPPGAQMPSAAVTAKLRLHQLWREGLPPNSPAAYAFALACVAAATLVRFGFGWLGGNVLPFACYYPAALIVFTVGGAEAALFAVVSSLLVVWWAFYAPGYGPPTRDEVVGFGLFLFASMLTVWLAERYRRFVRRLRAQDAATLEFIEPVVASFASVLLTTIVLLTLDSYLEAQHLVFGYIVPTTLIAMQYGSGFAFLTSFASGLAAAYFLFPPKFSIYIADPRHIAELGFFIMLALLASKAVAVLTSDARVKKPPLHDRSDGQPPR